MPLNNITILNVSDQFKHLSDLLLTFAFEAIRNEPLSSIKLHAPHDDSLLAADKSGVKILEVKQNDEGRDVLDSTDAAAKVMNLLNGVDYCGLTAEDVASSRGKNADPVIRDKISSCKSSAFKLYPKGNRGIDHYLEELQRINGDSIPQTTWNEIRTALIEEKGLVAKARDARNSKIGHRTDSLSFSDYLSWLVPLTEYIQYLRERKLPIWKLYDSGRNTPEVLAWKNERLTDLEKKSQHLNQICLKALGEPTEEIHFNGTDYVISASHTEDFDAYVKDLFLHWEMGKRQIDADASSQFIDKLIELRYGKGSILSVYVNRRADLHAVRNRNSAMRDYAFASIINALMPDHAFFFWYGERFSPAQFGSALLAPLLTGSSANPENCRILHAAFHAPVELSDASGATHPVTASGVYTSGLISDFYTVQGESRVCQLAIQAETAMSEFEKAYERDQDSENARASLLPAYREAFMRSSRLLHAMTGISSFKDGNGRVFHSRHDLEQYLFFSSHSDFRTLKDLAEYLKALEQNLSFQAWCKDAGSYTGS